MLWHATHVQAAFLPEAWSEDVEMTGVGSRLCRASRSSISGYGRLGLVFPAGTHEVLSHSAAVSCVEDPIKSLRTIS